MRGPRRRRSQRGAVLPIFLFSVLPLIGLFYAVHAVGWKLTNRLVVQNSADRAALSSAAVTAHALNEIAFLDSARVTLAATGHVAREVHENFMPLLTRVQSACAATRNPASHPCLLAAELRRLQSMGVPMKAVADDIASRELARTATALIEALIAETPAWAYTAAEDIAFDNGAYTASLYTDERLPFASEVDADATARASALARRLYGSELISLSPLGFGSTESRAAFDGNRPAVAGVEQVVPLEGMQSRLAHTVVVQRPSDDHHMRGRMAAAGVRLPEDGAFGPRMRLDVAVARAEPYFADVSARGAQGGFQMPDGRPGWSARLRPLDRPGDVAGMRFDDVRRVHIDEGPLTRAWFARDGGPQHPPVQ